MIDMLEAFSRLIRMQDELCELLDEMPCRGTEVYRKLEELRGAVIELRDSRRAEQNSR